MTKELLDKIIKDVLSLTEVTRDRFNKNLILSFKFDGSDTGYRTEYNRLVGKYLDEVYGIYDWNEEFEVYDELYRLFND